jgi:hypothetical protein
MSATQIIMAAGDKVTGGAWISSIFDTARYYFPYAVAVDSTRNIYLVGKASTAFIVKYSDAGTVLWQRKVGNSNSNRVYGVATDSANNVYITGQGGSGASGYIFIIKYDAVGVKQWQRDIDKSSAEDAGFSITVDSSSNIYVTGVVADGAYTILEKYNTNGVIQWKRSLDYSGIRDTARGVATDSAGNIFVVGGGNGDEYYTTTYAYLAKFTSSGVLTWQRKIDTASTPDVGMRIAIDSANNIYIGGTKGNPSAAANFAFIAKYNNSGVIQWQRKLDTASIYDGTTGLATDSLNNVYILTQVGTTASVISKYNSSGALQWQRKFSQTSGFSLTDLAIAKMTDGSEYFHLVGGASNYSAVLLKFLTDGIVPGTGSYAIANTITYGTGVVADTAGELTAANADLGIVGFSPDNWILSLSASYLTGRDSVKVVTNDSSNNYYIAGNNGNNVVFIAKYNSSNTLQWMRQLQYSDDTAEGIIVDNDNNVWVVGNYDSQNRSFIVRYNSSGVWQSNISYYPNSIVVYDIAKDTSGNIYVLGSDKAAKAIVFKFNSTGANIGQFAFEIAGLRPYGLRVDTSANMYIAGAYNTSLFVIKADYLGTILWQSALINDSSNNKVALALDSSGNSYVTGQNVYNTNTYLVKFDTNGPVHWQRRVGAGIGIDVDTDSSGNIYVLSQSTTSNSVLSAYTNAGELFAQRNILGSNLLHKVKVGANNTVYVAGDGTAQQSVVARLPTDASSPDVGYYTFSNTNGTTTALSMTASSIAAVKLLISTEAWKNSFSTGSSSTGIRNAIDSSNNSYVLVKSGTSTALCKFNNIGALVWESYIGGNLDANSVILDYLGNIYVGLGGSEATSAAAIIKFNSNGVALWSRGLSGSYCRLGGIAIDSAGSVYIGGFENNAGAYIAKYDTNGNIQWKRSYANMSISGIAVTANALYAMGKTGTNRAKFIKLSTDGASVLASGQYNLAYSSHLSETIFVDANDNIYFTGCNNEYTPDAIAFVTSLNSSGGLQWTRGVTATNGATAKGCYTDGSGNVYFVGGYGSSYPGSGSGFIVKYDSYGTLQWKRSLNEYMFGIAVSPNGSKITASGTGAIVRFSSDGNLFAANEFRGLATTLNAATPIMISQAYTQVAPTTAALTESSNLYTPSLSTVITFTTTPCAYSSTTAQNADSALSKTSTLDILDMPENAGGDPDGALIEVNTNLKII